MTNIFEKKMFWTAASLALTVATSLVESQCQQDKIKKAVEEEFDKRQEENRKEGAQ